MSFRLGDRIYKELLYLTCFDLTTENPLCVFTQLSDTSVETTAESTDVADKNGNLVKKIWKSKSCSVSGTNAFCNTNIVQLASGSEAEFASVGNEIIMPKMFHVNKGTDVTLTNFVDGTVRVAQYFGDGSIGKIYTLGEAADADKFAVGTGTGKLDLPTDPDAEMFYITYQRKVESGSLIRNRADKFPSSIKVIMKATYYNPCKKNELKADYIEFPSVQMSPEFTLPVNADSATMDIAFDAEIDYCGTDKVLYNVYSADEIDAD